ncbi:hypothetical protein KKC44_02395 [Patescibacteria group bacterium]|nr:hypothetical protein [Patescibacteria group bacterium]
MVYGSSLEALPDTPQGGPKETFEFPVFRSREELQDYLEDVGYDIDRLHAMGDSVAEREQLITSLKERNPTLNGNAEALVEHLRLNHQELERKESWYTKLLKLPGKALRYSWETVKAHPYITAAVVIGLTAAALYYSGAAAAGYGWLKAKVMESMVGEGAAGAVGAGKDAAIAAGEKVAEVGGAAGEAVGGAAESVGELIPEILEGAPDIGNIPGPAAGAGGALPPIPGL